MKYISKAIESYRTAVDIDPNDYRAWYGLGQTYEIHQMFNFALYYFINAARARPNDSRMWTAVGISYEKLKQCLLKENAFFSIFSILKKDTKFISNSEIEYIKFKSHS